MYDQRIKYFGDEAKVIDRKAYDAFKQFYRYPARYPMLLELYQKNFEMNGNDVADFNLIPYMTLAKFYYERSPEVMTGEMVLEIHSQVSEALAYKLANGAKPDKVKKDLDKIWLTASGGPFWDDASAGSDINLSRVLNHPVWKMGKM